MLQFVQMAYFSGVTAQTERPPNKNLHCKSRFCSAIFDYFITLNQTILL